MTLDLRTIQARLVEADAMQSDRAEYRQRECQVLATLAVAEQLSRIAHRVENVTSQEEGRLRVRV